VSALTSHVDSFVRDRLPPPDHLPEFRFDLASLDYPERLNCATELLDRRAERHPDRRCLIGERASWSYRELLERANRIARVLVEDLGVAPGARVMLRAWNGPMLVACWYAVMKAGGVAVTTMPLLRAGELTAMIAKAEIGVALCDAELRAELDRARSAGGLSTRICCFGEDEELDSLAASKPPRFENVDTFAEDPCLIAFTSGTTGQPKGAVHLHRDVIACCDCVPGDVIQPTSEDVFIGSPPLAFTFGLLGLACYPIWAGASSVLLERPRPDPLLEAIETHRATVCFTAPTTYRAWLGALDEHDISSLRVAISSGEALPASTWTAFKQATGLEIVNCLGSTEMLHSFISTSGCTARPGLLGKAIRGYEVAVLGADGQVVEPPELGRLAVRGPTGCRYLDDPRQREQVENGWNLTGDAVRADEQGCLTYEGRLDDMIVTAGYNIAAPEVEEALLAHPAVSECGVIGSPDAARGSVVKAFVVLAPGVTADRDTVRSLQSFVKEQIAPYKYPRVIEFVDRLPRTATGKLRRAALRDIDRRESMR
jgi:2-aminobenzoate-CoA ligase